MCPMKYVCACHNGAVLSCYVMVFLRKLYIYKNSTLCVKSASVSFLDCLRFFCNWIHFKGWLFLQTTSWNLQEFWDI
jgi:hypothetical protein